ncbi:MAG: hypothetical protein ACPGJS_15620 [Flammeovirgaceae bacterium]
MFKNKSYRKQLFLLPIFALLAYNGLFFILKNAQAIAGAQQRDHQLAEKFIAKHIPAGSKVVGEPLYFYAVLKNGSDFQYLNLYENLAIREKYHRENYKYDYLLVTDHLKMRDTQGCIDYYLSQAEFEQVAELNIKESKWAKIISNLNIGGFPLLSNVEKHTYSAVIYKRIKL